MRSAFKVAWSISGACAFVLLTACSQGVSPDGPAEDPIDTASPSDGPVEDPTATPSPSDGWIRYQDPEGHFAVSYPAGWNVDDNGPAAAFTPDATHSFPRIAVSALSFTTDPVFGEPPKAQVRQAFEEVGFIPGSMIVDEGPRELDGERAYFAIFVEAAAGYPITHLIIVARVGRSKLLVRTGRPRELPGVPTHRPGDGRQPRDSGLAGGLPQHPDQHRPEGAVLLAVDQEFVKGPGCLPPLAPRRAS